MVDPKFKVGDRWLTRDGSTVEIVAIVPRLEFQIVGIKEGWDEPFSWDSNGRFLPPAESPSDLVSKVPNTRRVYQVMLQRDDDIHPSLYCYATLEEAKRHNRNARVLCLIEPGFEVPVED